MNRIGWSHLLDRKANGAQRRRGFQPWCEFLETRWVMSDFGTITGFDNISWADVVRPRLTTIAQPVGAIGAKAVELMQERMSGAKIATRRTVFDVTLVERDSVKHLGHR